ncbi:MAG: ABC transporter permease [Gemmataceae bacterium]
MPTITKSIEDVPPIPAKLAPRRFDFSQLFRAVGLAARSLWLHKLRSVLSVLGIIIGTSAVISLMAFGKGSMQDALDDIKRQGATNIIVRSVKPPDDSATSSKGMVANYGLKYRDLERFSTFGDAIVRMVPMRVFASEVRYLERMHNSRLVATIPEYAEVNQIGLARGRFLVDEDDRNRENHCVLGANVADKLFPFTDPIGHTVDCRGSKYKVVGVMNDRMPTGGSGGSQAAEDYNNDIYVPLRTAEGWIGSKVMIRTSGSRSGEQVEITQVTITLSDVDKVRPVGAEILRMMKMTHDKMDYAVTIPLDRLEEAERQKDRFTMLLAVIASISLLVGGIGIMNIMLATVTERTREIGIRRALGAKRRAITTQFLVEAIVQTTVGGLLGVVLGFVVISVVPVAPGALAKVAGWVGLAETASSLTTVRFPAELDIRSIFVAVGASVAVGVGFGLYPAHRAAKLDPIEALRHVS